MLITSRWGGFFRPVDLDHVLMLFEFRRVQEMAAARLAATRATPAELRAVEVAMQQCRHGYAHGEVDVFNQGDDDFHTAVAAASHNTLLGSAVRDARRLQRRSSAIGIHDSLGEGTAPRSRNTRRSTAPFTTADPTRPPTPRRYTSTGRWRTTDGRSNGACSDDVWTRTCRWAVPHHGPAHRHVLVTGLPAYLTPPPVSPPPTRTPRSPAGPGPARPACP